MVNSEIRNANTPIRTLCKIQDILELEPVFKTPTQIRSELNLTSKSVSNAIAYLEQLNLVEVVTNGKTKFVRTRKVLENDNKNTD